MIREYTSTHPTIKGIQFSFKQAIVSMINCRRYLASRGFKEVCDPYHPGSIDSNLSGTIVFKDGIIVDNRAFCECVSDRDSFLEKIVSEECEFKRYPVLSNWSTYQRDKVVRVAFKDKDYKVYLSVIDTTRKKAGFPAGLFLIKPRKFALQYRMVLDKAFINENDIENFEEYKKVLQIASMHRNFKVYGRLTRRKPLEKFVEEKSESKPKFINPWEIEVPDLRGKGK